MEAALGRQYELAYPVGSMGLIVVPHQDDRAGEMTEEVEHELATDLGVDRPLLDHEEEMAFRSDGGDHRELGPIVVVPEDRGLATGCPGLPDEGDQGEGRFVREDDGRSEVPGFFLMVGQRVRTHAWTIASFRSSALRSGRCQLIPRVCSNRQTWSRW